MPACAQQSAQSSSIRVSSAIFPVCLGPLASPGPLTSPAPLSSPQLLRTALVEAGHHHLGFRVRPEGQCSQWGGPGDAWGPVLLPFLKEPSQLH